MMKLLIVIAAVFLTVVAGNSITKPAPLTIGCITVVDPVCCLKHGRFQQASNSCFCKAEGGVVVSEKFCMVRPPCLCTEILRPVCCCRRGGAPFTAPNACICRCRGGKVVYRHNCRKEKPSPTPSTTPSSSPTPSPSASPSAPPKPCICTREFVPVCCRLRNGKKVTTANPCLCKKCAKGRIVSKGKCPKEDNCICPAVFQPVCCRRGKELKTEGNSCQCTCDGGRVVSAGACMPKW